MIPAALPILLEAVLRALIAASALGIVLRLLRIKNVPAQKAAWGLMLVVALATPLLMRWQLLPSWAAVKLPTPVWTRSHHVTPRAAPAPAPAVSAVPVASSQTSPQAAIAAEDYYDDLPPISKSDFPVSPRSASKVPPAASPSIAATPDNPAHANLLPRVLAFAWLAYLAVVAALLLRLLIAFSASIRIWMRANPVEVLRDAEFPAGVPVRSSRQVASPVNILSGVVLPADYSSWDNEKLRVVLAHEYAHIQQHDYYLQLLAGLYSACTWFSPLGWWLKRKLYVLGEAISDHAGLEAATSPTAYAELLLEFAALPRPTLSGVAMARSTNLSERIERLLNESTFRQTFSGGRRVLVSLMVPAVLIAAASMVRVQAAANSSQAATPIAAAPSALQQPSRAVNTNRPHQASVLMTLASYTPARQEAAPAPAAAPAASQPQPAPAAVPAPRVHVDVDVPPMPPMHVHVQIPPMPRFEIRTGDFRFDEDPYALVGDPGTKTQSRGDWEDVDRGAEVEKARKLASGHFLLFRRDGKFYIIDDPAIVGQVEAMDKALQAQTEQLRALGKQMRDAVEPYRDQMHDQQQQERDAERKARETATEIPTPDLSKEMAELNAAVQALQAKQGGTITREQLSEIQHKISDVQRRVIEAEVKVKVNVDFDMSKFNEAQSKFSEQQNQFGAQMGQLGSQIGQAARENNEKIKSIESDSLSNGKARPVN